MGISSYKISICIVLLSALVNVKANPIYMPYSLAGLRPQEPMAVQRRSLRRIQIEWLRQKQQHIMDALREYRTQVMEKLMAEKRAEEVVFDERREVGDKEEYKRMSTAYCLFRPGSCRLMMG